MLCSRSPQLSRWRECQLAFHDKDCRSTWRNSCHRLQRHSLGGKNSVNRGEQGQEWRRRKEAVGEGESRREKCLTVVPFQTCEA